MARGYFPAGGFGNGGITTIVHGTLTVDGWQTDTDGTFYQPIVALGVTGAEDCHPQIQLEHIAGVAKSTWQAQCEVFGEFAASCWAETSEAVITFYCYEKPTVDLNIIAYGFDYVSNAVNIDTGTANIVQSNVNSDISVPSSKVVYDVNNELGARIDTLNSNLTPYYCDVEYHASGDVTFTGKVVFNYVTANVGGCYNTSTGEFTVPVNGLYTVVFDYYSNNTATNPRPSIMVNGSSIMHINGPYGQCLTVTRYFTAGQKITAGAYHANYPIALYAGGGHNRFMVALIQRC